MKLHIIAALCLATPAAAQQASDAGAWTVKNGYATVTTAAIGVPVRAGPLSLTNTAEASEKGKGLDNVAQFASEDSAVQGTVYVFFSSYADTALSTWATDRAVHQRYGPNVTLTDDRVVAVAGVPSAATRRIYEKAYLQPGAALVTAAGFVRAGSWLMGLRVTGPAARSAEVTAGIDALISGLRFDGEAKPMTAASPKLAAPCPVGAEKPAKYLSDKKTNAAVLFAGLLGGSFMIKNEGEEKIEEIEFPPAFPANGATAMCVRGTIVSGTTRNEVLQPANPDDGEVLLVPIDDAGGVLAVEPVLLGEGYVVKQYGIGFTSVMGSFKSLPSIDQIGAILTGRDAKGSMVRSTTVFTPDGNSTIQVNSAMFK